jgi:nitroreductase
MSVTVDNFYIRKSCRKFLPKPVSKELLNKLVEAGRRAPSVC